MGRRAIGAAVCAANFPAWGKMSSRLLAAKRGRPLRAFRSSTDHTANAKKLRPTPALAAAAAAAGGGVRVSSLGGASELWDAVCAGEAAEDPELSL